MRGRQTSDDLAFQALLREHRTRAELTQQQLADRLGRPQSFVSKYESGERRLDVIELREVCRAMSVSFASLCTELDGKLSP